MLASSVGISSCKKYEEGLYLSLRSKAERIENTWKAEKVIEDGRDVTSDHTDDRHTFRKGGDYALFSNSNPSISGNAKWQFIGDKDEIQIIYQGFFKQQIDTYKILKLKENELWLRKGDSELHLIPA